MTSSKRVEHGGGCWAVQCACDAAGIVARGRGRILVVSPQTTVLKSVMAKPSAGELNLEHATSVRGLVQYNMGGRRGRKTATHKQRGCELVRERYATQKACVMELVVHVAVQHEHSADTNVWHCGAWGLAEHDQVSADRSGVRFELLSLGVAGA